MSKEEILNIFYNNIVPEAFCGRIDCYFMYNTLFYTKIPQRNIELVKALDDYEDLIIPTLYVKDCDLFEELLVRYVEEALNFYDDSNFCEEILNDKVMKLGSGISKEKVIMTLLWSNATVEDFLDPCLFLKKRIDFFRLGNLDVYEESRIVGYSEILGADILCAVKKARIESETPYYLQTFLLNPEDGDKIYEFPNIYFGVSDGIASVYAIQNEKGRLINEDYKKKIERNLYKVNDGLDVKEDTYDNYGVGNLKDVTPSFLVGINIFVGLLKNCDIKNLEVASMLIARWNGKMIAMKIKNDYLVKKLKNEKDITKLVDEYYQKVLAIQSNLTEKFLRLFRRIGYHHSSVGILSYPMESSSYLTMCLYDQIDVCNNRLLDETFKISKNNGLKK